MQTKVTPIQGINPGLPVSEDDLGILMGLSAAIELCSEAIMGGARSEVAARALDTLAPLQTQELKNLARKIAQSEKGKDHEYQ